MEIKVNTVGFVGLGLIGGSIAKALRAAHPDMKIIGYNRSRKSLVAALEDGVLNDACDNIDEGFGACDMIFLCAPVNVNIACLRALKDCISPDCLITDVGSVKTPIHEAVEELGMEAQFIGGHPMTGSEQYGYENARARVLENAYYILSPTGQERPEHMKTYLQLVRDMKSLPIVLDYREHDRTTAAISHLPHLIAYSLVNLVHKADGPEERMRTLAAGGFRDITRIASSSAEMWQQICDENRGQLLPMLDDYIEELQRVKQAVAQNDADYLISYFNEAREYREGMPSNSSGSLKPFCAIYVDVADEPGAIAIIATILGANGLSIKNLRIQNNRESQEGALRITFGHEDAARQAAQILRNYNYTVFERWDS